MKWLAAVLLVLLGLASCVDPPSMLVHRPKNPDVDAAVTRLWTGEIQRVARDGDWILTRSYFLAADVISTVTPGESLSHASIYDARHGTVVEAVGSGIREIPLAQLVDRNHYVIVVRPSNMTAADQAGALARARTQLGGKFDASGMFGFDHEDEYYCSELVYWASQTASRSGTRERIITPSNLMKYGEVIYWSGKRDDPQILQLAATR
ncbi:MAG: Permuted papain-like amidase enzyme, YaeF/YiiX, family [Deltaproteobacteria bacterium]|nr:Permuted papain-like amidase enzyme, YaeF/YiiX, family [Deltaproteobacteria bacterium]